MSEAKERAYSLSKNGLLLNAGLNRRQAILRLNNEMSTALAHGHGVTMRGRNDDMTMTISNGNTYEMRGHG